MAPSFPASVVTLIIASVIVLPGIAEEDVGGPVYSPFAGQDFPDNLYWGDTHLHTKNSADAFGFEGELTPEYAYRFARGEKVISNTGQPVKLSRPLDFLVVSDHAEYLGVSALLEADPKALANSEIGQRWMDFLARDQRQEILMDTQRVTSGTMEAPSHDETVSRTVWASVIEAADRHNEPGKFTAFIGYEWTSLPDGNNLHRNVIFRDGAETLQDTLPFSALDSRNPEDLWRYLDAYQNRTGGRVLAIPHNANVSNGLMFSDRTYDGDPLTRAYGETRARWEPVVEVTQMKGDGETHPWLSPDDEFADFETWDYGNFAQPFDPKEKWMLEHEYARAALKNGLSIEATTGANPFKFGMIGSTDSHTALSAVEEGNFFGKFAVEEPSLDRASGKPRPAFHYVASGYAAVWARENTREAIFDAIQRREVYATTGPRMMVRFFGGWEFSPDDAAKPDYAAIGYEKGVPMGGDLSAAPEEGAPVFLVVASKDPQGANLDRVQIVKGWLADNGETGEKVYDIALSGDRAVNPETGVTPTLTSTVNVDTASYTNTVGAVQLATVWRDPDFNPGQRSFYYVRVLQIPTPRWTTYDSAFYDTPLPEQVPPEIQERAYSSPIWYTP